MKRRFEFDAPDAPSQRRRRSRGIYCAGKCAQRHRPPSVRYAENNRTMSLQQRRASQLRHGVIRLPACLPLSLSLSLSLSSLLFCLPSLFLIIAFGRRMPNEAREATGVIGDLAIRGRRCRFYNGKKRSARVSNECLGFREQRGELRTAND